MITMKVCSSSVLGPPLNYFVCLSLSQSASFSAAPTLKADHSAAASPASGHPKGWFSLQMADLAVSGLFHLQHCQT